MSWKQANASIILGNIHQCSRYADQQFYTYEAFDRYLQVVVSKHDLLDKLHLIFFKSDCTSS